MPLQTWSSQIKTANKSLLLGMLCALGATCFWSGNFIVARGVYEQIPPATLSFLRWSVASCVLAPFALGPLRRDWPVIRRNLPLLLCTALLGVTFFNTMLYKGAHSTSALNLALISTTFPVFTIVLSRFFHGEPITWRRFLGASLAIAGVTTLVTEGDIERLLQLTFKEGDLWMLLASLDFAVYSLLVRRRPREMGQISFLGFTFLAGLAMLCPWMLWEQYHGARPDITAGLGAAIIYVGLFASLAAYFLWNRAVLTIGPVKSGLIYYTLPVLSGVEAWLLLGEPLSLLHLTSGTCIIGGILLATFSGRQT